MSKSFAVIAALATFAAAPLWGSEPHHPLHGRAAAPLAPAQRAEATDQAKPG